MKQNPNLDKKPAKNNPFLEELESSGLDVNEMVDDVEEELEFEDDGSLTVADDLLDSEDDDGEEEEDSLDDAEAIEDEAGEETDPEPEPQKKAGAKKQLSPADIKVIALKKENQRLIKENKEFLEAQKAKDLEKEKDGLNAKFLAEGYDEDTAKTMANTEIRLKQMEERSALLDFKEANEEVFRAYPQAKADSAMIMRNVKLTGMTAEQICKGLYGAKQLPEAEIRATKAAQGLPTRDTSGTRSSFTPIGTGADTGSSLTPQERAEKRILEKMFNDGKSITDKDYRKHTGKE